MLKRILIIFSGFIILMIAIGGMAVWDKQNDWRVVRPDIAFAPLVDNSLHDPDNPAKTFRIDMARVEHDYPLSRTALASLYPRHIRALGQEEIDQLYGRLSAGTLPDGPYQGDLMFPTSGRQGEDFLGRLKFWRQSPMRPRLAEILGGLGGRMAESKIRLLEKIGRKLWKGKLFDSDKRIARNFIEDFGPLKELIDDPSLLQKINVRNTGWLRLVKPRTEVWALFPAKMHCGQSLLDARRESIVIDYAYNDDIAGYQKRPDGLAGRNGLRIRDEIRMVRPGFYLGRGYLNRIFLINFILYNRDVAAAGRKSFIAGEQLAEDCWVGEQKRHRAAK